MSKPSDSSSHSSAESERDRYFRVDHLDSTLRARSVRGGAVTLANQAAKFALTLGSTIVLARLLTPEDFGLIAMVMAIVGFVTVFKDMGLSMATLQRADINHRQVSTLFWINVLIAACIAIAAAAFSPLVAWFYKEPRLVRIMLVLAGTILFSGLCVQHQALLRRQMRFGELAAVEITALALAVAAGIAAAVLGAGYWALVILHVSRECFNAAGVWIMCGWRPGRPERRSGVRSMVAFGGHLTGFNIVNYFARNLDKVLIGWHWGAAPLGLYYKAYQMLLLPVQQVSSPLIGVAIATLSRLQNQPERYRAYYRRGLMMTVTFGMPAVAFLFVAADEAILTLLGRQWVDAVSIFRALAPAAFVGTFYVATGWVYLSLGRAGRQLRWGLFASTVTVLAFLIGLRWGPIGVGAAYSIVVVSLMYPAMRYCFRVTHVTVGDVAAALWRPAGASIAAGAALFAIEHLADVGFPVAVLFLGELAAYFILYVLAWVALPGGRRALRESLRLARDLRRTPRSPDEPSEPADPGI